jgi:hypothetical protein
MRNRLTVPGGLALLFLPPAVPCKEPKNALEGLDLTQRYLVTECGYSADCIQKVLNPAGAAGYRFATGDLSESEDDSGHSADILVLMEKPGEGNPTYQYIKSPRTAEGLNEAASRGFRLAPRFPLERWVDQGGIGRGLSLGGRLEQIGLMLMEKPSNSDLRYQYLVFSVSKSFGDAKASELFPNMEKAVNEGFEIVQLRKTGHGYIIVLEKTINGVSDPLPKLADASTPSGLPRYRLLTAWKSSDLQKELAAATGYRAVAADLDGPDGPYYLLLEKVPGSSHAYEYVVPEGLRMSTLEKNINNAAAKGFRLHPFTRAGVLPFVLMERRSDSAAFYQYQILQTVRLSTMRKELAEAARKGFAVVVAFRGYALMLERPR